MRMLLIGGLLATLVLALSACGSSSTSSGSSEESQKQADLYAIDQIERTWHEAASAKDLDKWMTIWAPNATFTVGGKTYTGTAAIRKLLSGVGPMQPQNQWVSDTPSYKIRATVSGDKGTLYFECDYVDVTTGKVANVVAADQDVQRIDGKWLITNSVAASTQLKR
jgi:SnoaL-like domain